MSLKTALSNAADLVDQLLTLRFGSAVTVDNPTLPHFRTVLKPLQALPRIEMISVDQGLVGDTYLIAIIGKPASSGIPDSEADLHILYMIP